MVMLLAFFSMFIDHVWFIFSPDKDFFRIVWRIAYPLFAYWIVRWYFLTKNRLNYFKRLLILAIWCQIPFWLFFWFDYYNVVFTLSFWLLSISILWNKNINIFLKIIIISILLFISEIFNFDYSIYWILTIILIYLFWEQKVLILYFTLLTILFYNIDYSSFKLVYHYQIFAPIAFVILYFTPILKYDFKLNLYFKYLFYPGHLLFLYLLYIIINKF